ncbi:MAG: SDR family oxidoreductase [Woeseiaceae bacterium]|nr:SDR family oxidoreductase [Woeseiaceae bacterium]
MTGAVGNLGAAVARAFAACNAKLALADRGSDRLAEAFSDLADSSPLLLPDSDVTDEASVKGMVKRVLEESGRIDVLVNTVGGYRADTPVHEMSLDFWQQMLDLNARSVLLTCRAVLPAQLDAGHGKIVNVAARPGLKGSAGAAAYSAAKSAVIRLTESMAAEVRDKGVNVNCILPGTIDTPQNRDAMPDAETSKWVQPESLADVVLFLASDAARDIHGAAIPVYGRS